MSAEIDLTPQHRSLVTTSHPAAARTIDELATPPSPRRLRLLLVACDTLAAASGWAVGSWLAGPSWTTASVVSLWLLGLVGVAVTLAGLVWQRLYRSRECAIRSVEMQRIGRAVIAAALVVALGAQLGGDTGLLAWLLACAAATFALLTLGRTGYRAALTQRRRSGQLTRTVVLVGANHEAAEFKAAIDEHPECGVRIRGLVCDPAGASVAAQLRLPWLGPVADVEMIIREQRATGALAVASALRSDELDWLVRRIPATGGHLHVLSGLHRVASQRIRTLPIAYEPVLYVEPIKLRRGRQHLKRTLDLVGATILLVLALPVLLAAAAAIKLDDGGPVLFRQRRIGRGGAPLELLKLRTMTTTAEAQRAALADRNVRTGPLFKIADDPRITRCGRFLRRSSIDELPQLLNVLRGDMSLVGPRPALPDEHNQFDPQLQERLAVRPGLTGMWQVEARDNPAFGPYRRLDLYYVENWSVGLDLSILLATVMVVLTRVVPRPSIRRRALAVMAAQNRLH